MMSTEFITLLIIQIFGINLILFPIIIIKKYNIRDKFTLLFITLILLFIGYLIYGFVWTLLGFNTSLILLVILSNIVIYYLVLIKKYNEKLMYIFFPICLLVSLLGTVFFTYGEKYKESIIVGGDFKMGYNVMHVIHGECRGLVISKLREDRCFGKVINDK